MTRLQKKTENMNTAVLLLVGALCSGILLIILTMISAFIVFYTKNPTSLIGLISIAVMLLTGAISGFSISKLKGEGGILISCLSSLLFILILLMIGLIAGGGHISLGNIINYLCYMAVSLLFSFFGRKKEKKYRRR